MHVDITNVDFFSYRSVFSVNEIVQGLCIETKYLFILFFTFSHKKVGRISSWTFDKTSGMSWSGEAINMKRFLKRFHQNMMKKWVRLRRRVCKFVEKYCWLGFLSILTKTWGYFMKAWTEFGIMLMILCLDWQNNV